MRHRSVPGFAVDDRYVEWRRRILPKPHVQFAEILSNNGALLSSVPFRIGVTSFRLGFRIRRPADACAAPVGPEFSTAARGQACRFCSSIGGRGRQSVSANGHDKPAGRHLSILSTSPQPDSPSKFSLRFELGPSRSMSEFGSSNASEFL